MFRPYLTDAHEDIADALIRSAVGVGWRTPELILCIRFVHLFLFFLGGGGVIKDRGLRLGLELTNRLRRLRPMSERIKHITIKGERHPGARETQNQMEARRRREGATFFFERQQFDGNRVSGLPGAIASNLEASAPVGP